MPLVPTFMSLRCRSVTKAAVPELLADHDDAQRLAAAHEIVVAADVVLLSRVETCRGATLAHRMRM